MPRPMISGGDDSCISSKGMRQLFSMRACIHCMPASIPATRMPTSTTSSSRKTRESAARQLPVAGS